MDLIDRAREFATRAHAGQTYGDYPYTKHLADVAALLTTFGASPDVVAAGWLHDVVEDTAVTLDEVRAEFGDVVAEIVDACTDPPGRNRRERKAAALGRLRAASPGARAVKLADRAANTFASRGGPLEGMYRREYVDFVHDLGTDDDFLNRALVGYLRWLNQ